MESGLLRSQGVRLLANCCHTGVCKRNQKQKAAELKVTHMDLSLIVILVNIYIMFSHRMMSLSGYVLRLHSCERWDYIYSICLAEQHLGLRRFYWMFTECIYREVFSWCSPTLLTEGHREPLINAFQHPAPPHTHSHNVASSTPRVKHLPERNNEILTSFWGDNWAITSRHQPEQSSTSCEMLAKCFTEFFHLLPPVSDHGSSTGTCWCVFPCQISQATDNLNCSSAHLFNSSDLFQSRLNIAPKKTNKKNKKKNMWVQLTNIIIFKSLCIHLYARSDPAAILGAPGLGQQLRMHSELCLLCATAPVCIFLLLFSSGFFLFFLKTFLLF